jgi:type IV fimbrial biogenesis protein FimT
VICPNQLLPHTPAQAPLEPGGSPGRPATPERGFTIMELLAVLAIIGILAAAASPSFVKLMRDGRVGSAATNIADIYRVARSRALGRGSAVMVRFNDSTSVPHLVMREAIRGETGIDGGSSLDACAPSPSPTCTGTDWADSSDNSKYVMSFDDRSSQYSPARSVFVKPDGTVMASGSGYAEICFTPRGRTFIRHAAADAFEPLIGVARIEVENTKTTLVRQVLVPPSGAARVVSRL